MKLLSRLLTNNLKRVPLVNVTFNYDRYKKYGKEGSCIATAHPILSDDETLKQMFEIMVNYIRDNYDMNEVV